MGSVKPLYPDPDIAGRVTCLECGQTHLEEFLTLPHMPTLDGAVWTDRQKALDATCADMVLVICPHCGCIFNRVFDQSLIAYEPGYEISLHHSAVYRHFLHDTVERLISTYHLHQKRIVEIACGQGYVLSLLCRAAGNEGYGFDPSIERERVEQKNGHPIRFVRDIYDARSADIRPDFVCCRHVFHSVSHPREFLQSILNVSGNDADPVYYFEIPNADYAFEPTVCWSIMYEYHSFFSPETLATMFGVSGYDVLRCQACYHDGQYIALEARRRRGGADPVQFDRDAVGRLLDKTRNFARHFEARKSLWQNRLAQFQADGKRVLGWGAGGRAISFLCTLDIREQIPYVVDINPYRQGAFLPRTGQQIVPPSYVKEYRPDIIVVTNPTYLQEIRTEVAAMHIECEFLVI